MISLFRFAAARRLAALPFLLAAASLCATPDSHAADEQDSGGTFNTPGYPARNATATNPGAPGAGAAGPAVPAGAGNAGSPNPSASMRGNGTTPRPATSNADLLQQQQQRRALQPPPKPTEFQRFVEDATGRQLPIFGSRFFRDAADTYQSLDNVPVSADYTVGPGDEIVTRAWGSIDVDYRSTVDRNGMLNLPKVGSFNVAGVKAVRPRDATCARRSAGSTPTST